MTFEEMAIELGFEIKKQTFSNKSLERVTNLGLGNSCLVTAASRTLLWLP